MIFGFEYSKLKFEDSLRNRLSVFHEVMGLGSNAAQIASDSRIDNSSLAKKRKGCQSSKSDHRSNVKLDLFGTKTKKKRFLAEKCLCSKTFQRRIFAAFSVFHN